MPRTFLSLYGANTIIDEAQRVPSLFSYLQGKVDETGRPGQYIVSGSQNFLLMDAVSQSLAGRVAIRHLMPLSYSELKGTPDCPETIEGWVVRGGYPRLYDVALNPDEYFPSYVQTYIDRDMRREMGVMKVSEFNRFVSLCATRIGNLVNIQGLATECGINARTAKEWLGLLEQSFVVKLLNPFHRNFGKRLVKTPKLYFCDTGLACSLLGVESKDDLVRSSFRGPLFENAVFCEMVKDSYARGRMPSLSFWRDSGGREIDFIVDKAGKIERAIEAKASATYSPRFFSALERIGDQAGIAVNAREVVYSGADTFQTKHGTLRSFADLN